MSKASSSSNLGGPATSSKDATTTSQVAKLQGATVDLVVSPHLGCLLLDKPFDDDRCFLVHQHTLERAALPRGGDWAIEYDDSGFAALVDLEDIENLCLHNVLGLFFPWVDVSFPHEVGAKAIPPTQ